MKTRKLTRTFRLRHEMMYHGSHTLGDLIDEVLSGLEGRTLKVYDPSKEKAANLLVRRCKRPDGIKLEQRPTEPTLPIEISDWLCVGCQRIYMDSHNKPVVDPDALAHYRNNIRPVIVTENSETIPDGPGGFFGEIVVSFPYACAVACAPDRYRRIAHDAFRLTIAHELVHVLNCLQFLVPAFMSWRKFWKNICDDGLHCETVACVFSMIHESLDQYREPAELAMIKSFWPRKAEAWFDAHHRFVEKLHKHFDMKGCVWDEPVRRA